MQCGAGARPEWAGKRLVALKRMKRVWEGGWKQAKTLGELVVSSLDEMRPKNRLLMMPRSAWPVPAPHTLAPGHHPSVRRLHLPKVPRALLRF